MLDPDQRHHHPLYGIESRAGTGPINHHRLNQCVVDAFPADHAPASRLHVTEPIGLLAKGEWDYKAIRRRPCAQRRCVGATGAPSSVIDYGKHWQVTAPGERQYKRIEAPDAHTQ